MTNSVWQAPIQNATGDIVIGAEITVIDEGTGLNATIFSTRGGAALTNPFFSDANGFAQFYAGPGEYRIEALDNGTGLTQTLRYVRLGDSGSVDTGTATGETPLNSQLGSASTKNAGTATGEIPTADDLLVVGETNFSTSNYQPTEIAGLNSKRLMKNVSGLTISRTQIVAASSLNYCIVSTSGAVIGTAQTAVAGTWKQTDGGDTINNAFGYFTRTV